MPEQVQTESPIQKMIKEFKDAGMEYPQAYALALISDQLSTVVARLNGIETALRALNRKSG
jgi:hypothetical protein